jgi:DNA-directed RNA polymerase specialized sigma24 family protein
MEFAEFYQSARDDCLRIVLLSVGDRQLAEDLVAEGGWRCVSARSSPLEDAEVAIQFEL